MGRFTVIPKNTFDELQMDAGVILKNFNPAAPVAPRDEDIVCATTGGITVSCTPTFSDLGEDVDNCPVNMKELKHLDSWDCKMSFTSLGTSAESIRLALGAADVNATSGAIIPRKDLKQSDFSDLWWVGDKANGGMVAVQLKNALSTSGFSLKTTKNGKGNVSVELTGHVSIENQAVMPMAFYSSDEAVFTVTFNSNGGTPVDTQYVADGGYATEPEDPTMQGYDFDGWYTDAAFTTPWDFAVNTVTEDTTLFAKWVEA